MKYEMNCLNAAKKFHQDLLPYKPFPTCTDRSFWTSLPSSLEKQLIREGEESLQADWPDLKATDYMAFCRSGNRGAFETAYFKRRHLLNKLILAECVEDSGRFLDAIIDGIWSICEESGWALPAHNTYIRDTPQEILPITDKPVIDLFACETGAMLAMAHYLLRDKLDKISPIICARIEGELNYRVIMPYTTKHFWWMGCGDEPMCNWTVWCTQNILLTAFLTDICTPQLHQEILLKAAASVDYFLKDYGEDGCCDEGAHYYRHAGLCLFGCLSILNDITNGGFSALYEDVKIRNIAAYIVNMNICGPYYFNFADCTPLVGLSGVREYLFGKATSQKKLMDFAAGDCMSALSAGTLLDDESQTLNLYYRTQSLCHISEVAEYAKTLEVHADPGAPASSEATTDNEGSDSITTDILYPSVGIRILRNRSFALAVKFGDNDDSHNHNDTGSLILYKNAKPVLVDIGVETYTAKTFSADRYEIWTMQSCYHNLPTIDGFDQAAGPNFMATDIKQDGDLLSASITMDLSAAYAADLLPYHRSIRFLAKQNMVELRDVTDNPNVTLNFITYEKPIQVSAPEKEANGSSGSGQDPVPTQPELSLQIGDAVITCHGASLCGIDTLPITDARLKASWDHDLYRIRLSSSGDFTMSIK